MNTVSILGRLTADPQAQYSQSGTALTKFTLAVDRMKKDEGADFIRIVAFGKLAEVCGSFLQKGQKAAVTGRIQTGSYKDKDGRTIYTTDVIASAVDFLDKPQGTEPRQEQVGFNEVDEALPF